MAHYKALLINSIFGLAQKIGAGRDAQENEVAYDVHSVKELRDLFRAMLSDGTTFDTAVFTTHGNPGRIYLDGERLNWHEVYEVFFNDKHDYASLFTRKKARILFGGCNVAEGDEGWKFLFAVARTFLRNGGDAFGWTSVGFAAPFGLRNGHVIHLWGDTRQVTNMGGNSFRFYEDFDLIESRGVPGVPDAVKASFG